MQCVTNTKLLTTKQMASEWSFALNVYKDRFAHPDYVKKVLTEFYKSCFAYNVINYVEYESWAECNFMKTRFKNGISLAKLCTETGKEEICKSSTVGEYIENSQKNPKLYYHVRIYTPQDEDMLDKIEAFYSKPI